MFFWSLLLLVFISFLFWVFHVIFLILTSICISKNVFILLWPWYTHLAGKDSIFHHDIKDLAPVFFLLLLMKDCGLSDDDSFPALWLFCSVVWYFLKRFYSFIIAFLWVSVKFIYSILLVCGFLHFWKVPSIVFLNISSTIHSVTFWDSENMLWLLILCFLPLNFLFDFYLIISQYWFQKDLLGYLPLHTSPFIFYLICLLTNLMKSSFHCRPSVVEHLCNPSTQRLWQENHEFDTSLGYIMRSSLTNKNVPITIL
jgi:hypothetical protein